MSYVVLCTECTGSYTPAESSRSWAVQWTVRGDLIDFVVSADATGWVGIGFSENSEMVSSYINTCTQTHAKCTFLYT